MSDLIEYLAQVKRYEDEVARYAAQVKASVKISEQLAASALSVVHLSAGPVTKQNGRKTVMLVWAGITALCALALLCWMV